MTITTTTLRPGILVPLSIRTHGNVSYMKTILESAQVDDDGKETATWNTTRTITDKAELERAKKTVSKARSIVSAVCAKTAFGLLCPEADEDKLKAAIAEARAVCDEFNSTATVSRVMLYVMPGKVAPDDVEAVKSINREIKDLLAEMAEGIKNTDVKVIRDAANRAKQLGSMLTSSAEARVEIAIDTARKAARQIVKAGAQASLEIDKLAIEKISAMRTSFLDLSEGDEIAKPQQQTRAIDFSEPSNSESSTYAVPARNLDNEVA